MVCLHALHPLRSHLFDYPGYVVVNINGNSGSIKVCYHIKTIYWNFHVSLLQNDWWVPIKLKSHHPLPPKFLYPTKLKKEENPLKLELGVLRGLISIICSTDLACWVIYLFYTAYVIPKIILTSELALHVICSSIHQLSHLCRRIQASICREVIEKSLCSIFHCYITISL